MSIRINYDGIKYRVRNSRKIKRFLDEVIREENKLPGELIIIVTDDENVLKINREFLNHDYFTDVIAFDYGEKNVVNGEIFVSIDTVRRNARYYGCSVQEEVIRVMTHGILHLCGYRDGNVNDREKMITRQEEKVKEIRSELL